MNIKDILTNWIVKNVALAIVLVLAIVLCSNFLLGVITKHGKSIEVPDFTNMTVAEATASARDLGLRIQIYDSTYVRKVARGAVISQNPTAGSPVKSGRRILLTINAKNAKKVSMPDLVGRSLREAKAEINSRGLVLGRLIYQSDIATDNVLEQQYRGSRIRKGSQIESGSKIDLVVGFNDQMEGNTDIQTYVPNVVGMKYSRSVDVIHDHSLNVNLNFDKGIKTYSDSLDAVVYKQSPEASSAPTIKGEDVTLYLKLVESK